MVVISGKDISKAYGTDIITEDVCFGVEKGDRVGIVGANGSGKSTLMGIIAGDTEPTSGEIYIRRDFSLAYLKQNKTGFVQVVPDATSSNTTLTEQEVNNVMERLLEYQEKYFQDIPLPPDLDKNFVWNVPKKVYNASMKNRLLDQPDCLDPLYWYYCMLLDEPEDMLPKFILSAVNVIMADDDLSTLIEEKADEYDHNYGIYDSDDEEE